MICEISFDLWGTLIRANPRFKGDVAQLVHEITGISATRVKSEIADIKQLNNIKVEKNGYSPTPENLFTELVGRLSLAVDVHELMFVYKKKFLEHPPFFLENELTRSTIIDLSRRHKLHIVSNTMMIGGTVLEKLLVDYLDVAQFFASMTFSDIVGTSKPDRKIFECSYKNTSCSKDQIVHLGDNYCTDYLGAIDFGYNAVLLHGDIGNNLPKVNNSVGSIAEFSSLLACRRWV